MCNNNVNCCNNFYVSISHLISPFTHDFCKRFSTHAFIAICGKYCKHVQTSEKYLILLATYFTKIEKNYHDNSKCMQNTLILVYNLKPKQNTYDLLSLEKNGLLGKFR